MIWLQENWIVALVVLIVVIALLWWLAARRRPEEIATPTIEPATPAKPLEPARPDIVAAEPAFKKVATPPPAPAPAPVAETSPPAATPLPVAEIGRASCRERVCQYVSISVVAGSLKKKTSINTNT